MPDRLFNVFIDKSFHLENDHFPVMGIGYIKVPDDYYDQLKHKLKQIKSVHRMPTELKRSKISVYRIVYHEELLK
jgi:hypothetical protein